jgi:hypothetical protein
VGDEGALRTEERYVTSAHAQAARGGRVREQRPGMSASTVTRPNAARGSATCREVTQHVVASFARPELLLHLIMKKLYDVGRDSVYVVVLN